MVSPQKFSSFLRKPYSLRADEEAQLREAIDKYPYFNNAWLLLTRSLHNQNSDKLEASLKQATMYAGDRDLLYKLVNIETEEDKQSTTTTTTAPVVPAEPPKKTEDPVVAKEQKEEPATVVEEQPKEVAPAEPKQEVEETTTAKAEEGESTAEVAVEESTPIVEEKTEETTDKAEQLADATEKKVEEKKKEANTEEDKVKSAYEEIFGAKDDKQAEEAVSEDFETFDINERVATEDEPVLPDFDEDDFVLQMDDDDTTDLMADEIVGDEANTETEQELEAESNIDEESKLETEEEFELNVGERLDADGDGVVVPPPAKETSEENFELNVADAIADNEEATEKVEVQEESALPENEESVEAIAFKLENKEVETVEQPVEAKEEKQEENNLLAPSTFFEWLTQLKNPDAENSEKKNEISDGAPREAKEVTAKEANQQESTLKEEAPQKKTSVDDIIDKFIQINPSISRPKAEFYNPEVKSKTSDTESDDLATETLAKIYLEQNLNDKAIEVYQRLATIHPEKATEYQAKIKEVKSE